MSEPVAKTYFYQGTLRKNFWFEKLVLSKIFWVIFTLLGFSYPIYRTLIRELPDRLPIHESLPEFALLNGFSQTLTTEDFKGKLVIFTHVNSSCVEESCFEHIKTFQTIQKRVKGLGQKIQLVMLATNANTDTPKNLYHMGRKVQANPFVWSFLTGPQQEINKLRKILFLPNNDDSTLILVDPQGRIRGRYQETRIAIDQLMIDVGLLANLK